MFDCDKCGECCRNLHKSPVYKNLHNGNGSCYYLNGDICSIYKDRPLLCNIEECYEAMFKEKLSYEEYINLNYKGCKKLKKSRRR